MPVMLRASFECDRALPAAKNERAVIECVKYFQSSLVSPDCTMIGLAARARGVPPLAPIMRGTRHQTTAVRNYK